MIKKALFIIATAVLLMTINNLIHSIYDIWSKQDLLKQAQGQLNKEEAKNQKLKAAVSYVQTQKFIEEEARNKLFLIKPGEQQVLISSSVILENKKKNQDQIPNWQKWLQLFF